MPREAGNDRLDPNDVEYRLWAYSRGELDAAGTAEVRRLLQQDGRLREELRRCAVLDERLEALGRKSLEGIDYDDQRAAITALLERRSLLAGRKPRRRPVLRIIYRALAAAAVVAAGVSAALLILGPEPTGPVGPAEGVVVVELPRQEAAAAEVTVEFRQPGWHEVRLSEDEPPGEKDIPSGTVIVSVGLKRTAPADGFMGFPLPVEIR